MSDQQILALFEPGSYEIVPHDGMRRTIAQRLVLSQRAVEKHMDKKESAKEAAKSGSSPRRGEAG